jgi:hypothetical protein
MRWNNKFVNPNEGDQRVIKKFLFFPKNIDGQTRWLEWARILQRYCHFESSGRESRYWVSIKWGEY